jgi:hypothetical protein
MARTRSRLTQFGVGAARGAARLARRCGRAPAGAAGRLARRSGRVAAGAAGRVGRAATAALGGPTGRRLGRMAALTLALALLVVVLYEHGDVPGAAARAESSGSAGGGAGQTSGRAGAAGERSAGSGDAGPAQGQGSAGRRGGAAPDRSAGADRSGGAAGGRGSAASRPVGERPAEVAAAWYAARHHLPRKLVRPLQQDRISAREVRVLVLADPGGGRVRTALVRVRLGRSGWAVP